LLGFITNNIIPIKLNITIIYNITKIRDIYILQRYLKCQARKLGASKPVGLLKIKGGGEQVLQRFC
jgi:hypothetical protein